MRQEISIHAPRTGSDAQWYDTIQDCIISIHAPRTGSDTTPRMRSTTTRHFNPRSPHGERRAASSVREVRPLFQSTLPARGATSLRFTTSSHTIKFQSTLPARGATEATSKYRIQWAFQSTLPARGATLECAAVAYREKDFNPRSPHGERQSEIVRLIAWLQISIHAPRTGSDSIVLMCGTDGRISIHAPRTGSDSFILEDATADILISIHAPRTGSDAAE